MQMIHSLEQQTNASLFDHDKPATRSLTQTIIGVPPKISRYALCRTNDFQYRLILVVSIAHGRLIRRRWILIRHVIAPLHVHPLRGYGSILCRRPADKYYRSRTHQEQDRQSNGIDVRHFRQVLDRGLMTIPPSRVAGRSPIGRGVPLPHFLRQHRWSPPSSGVAFTVASQTRNATR